MNPLLVASLLITASLQTPPMARNRILVRLDAPLIALINCSAQLVVQPRGRGFPAKRQIRGRDYLDEVHEVVCHLIGSLERAIKRVDVVVCPSSRSRSLVVLIHIRDNHIAQLRSESQMVDNVGECMTLILEVILQIVDVQVPVRETLSRGNVKVSNDLVDGDGALEPAPLCALGIKMFGVVLAFALFDAFAATKGPGYGGVSFANFVTGVAAAGFDACSGWGRAVAFATVGGVEMLGVVFVSMMVQISFSSLQST
jgi:hypothetical protein